MLPQEVRHGNWEHHEITPELVKGVMLNNNITDSSQVRHFLIKSKDNTCCFHVVDACQSDPRSSASFPSSSVVLLGGGDFLLRLLMHRGKTTRVKQTLKVQVTPHTEMAGTKAAEGEPSPHLVPQ